MSRVLLCAAVLIAPFAFGQNRPIAPVDCDDNYAECKEDCAIHFGGTTNLWMRAKLNPCLNKCNSVERDCRDTFFETRRNNLDEGSIAGAPTSRDVDSDGLPTKTAQKKPEPKKVDRHDEDLRESTAPAPAPSSEKAKAPEPVREETTPKSSRSQVKTEADKSPPPPAAAAPRKEEPAPRAEEPPPPPPKKEEKKREEPPKKEEKKKRALDEWDPEAM